MDPYLLGLLKLVIMFIVMPLSAIGLIFFTLKKLSNKKFAIMVSGLALLSFSYFIVTDIYPRQGFFERNFEENVNLEIPDNAKFISSAGNESIWGFGDYQVVYVYEFSSKDNQNLYEGLIRAGFMHSENWFETEEMEKVLNNYPHRKVSRILTKNFSFKRFDVLYLDDNKTIIFSSNKW